MGLATPWVAGCPASVCALPTKHCLQKPKALEDRWRSAGSTSRRADAARAGLVRTLRPRPADSPLLDLASNDYLGLTRHPEVTEGGGTRPPATWGGGATGSRLVTGHHRAPRRTGTRAGRVLRLRGGARLLLGLRGQPRRRHRARPARLADRLRRGQPRLAHRRLPARPRHHRRSSRTPTRTPCAKALRHARGPRRRRLRLGLLGGRRRGPAGRTGRGVPGARRRAGRRRRARARRAGRRRPGRPAGGGPRGAPTTSSSRVTLSKSLGSQGGAVLGPARVIDHLVNAARTFIFDTGLAPAAAGAALAALRLLRREPRAGGAGARGRGRTARTADRRGPAGGTPGRRRGLRARAVPRRRRCGWAADCRDRRARRRLLPAPVGARRHLTAAADRPRGPHRRADRTRCTGDRRDTTMSRRETAVRRTPMGRAV